MALTKIQSCETQFTEHVPKLHNKRLGKKEIYIQLLKNHVRPCSKKASICKDSMEF